MKTLFFRMAFGFWFRNGYLFTHEHGNPVLESLSGVSFVLFDSDTAEEE